MVKAILRCLGGVVPVTAVVMARHSTRSGRRAYHPVVGQPPARSRLLAAALLALASPARAAEVVVSWDGELAQPADRQAYERQLLEMVRDARAWAVAETGLEPGAHLSVEIHSRAAYARRFGSDAVHLDAARFTGEAVHVNGGARLDDRLAGLLVHEMVHAALDARGTARALPRWLDEGLAERAGWRRRGLEWPAPNQVAELKQARERRELSLPRSGEVSRLGYLTSWAAVVFLEGEVGRERVLAAVRATLAGEPFEKALRREAGMSPEGVDRAFDDWVGKL